MRALAADATDAAKVATAKASDAAKDDAARANDAIDAARDKKDDDPPKN